jgi:hypothetical protein
MDTAGSQSQGSQDRMSTNSANACPLMGTVLGLAGGIAGGVLGYFLFKVIAAQGFYAIVLPGALVGIGCGALSGRKSTALGIASAILALAAGILAEWSVFPFRADKSLTYFLTHIHKNSTATLVLIAIGAICAFYFARGRKRGAWLRKSK